MKFEMTIAGTRISAHRTLRNIVGCAAAMLAAPFAAQAQTVFDAAADFSATSNPNGAWSFGYEYPLLGSVFNPATTSGNYLGVDYWQLGGPDLPGAFHNPTLVTNLNYGTAIFEPGMLILHPGSRGEYSIARFTAPVAGSYTFSATFIGQDQIIGTTTDVHVLVNSGPPVLSALIHGFHATASTGLVTVSLQPGNTIDAAVGYGSNSQYYGDSTGLDFRVELVPAPCSAAILGLAGLVGLRRRR